MSRIRKILMPILMLNEFPIFYQGKKFILVNFGFFAALNTILILQGFFFYCYSSKVNFSYSIAFWIFLLVTFTLFGAKFLHPFIYGKKFWQSPIYYLRQTTMYSQSGEIAALLVIIFMSILENINILILFDGMCYGAVLGLAIGRLGCYNYGCCFGKPTKGYLSVRYTNKHSKILRLLPQLKNVPVYPTQLYSSLFNLLLFVLFNFLHLYQVPNGVIAGVFAIFYGLFRFVIEKYREEFNIKIYKLIATLYILLGFTLLFFVFFILPESLTIPTSIQDFNIRFFFNIMFRGDLYPWYIVTFIVSFIYYGVHFKELGKHF